MDKGKVAAFSIGALAVMIIILLLKYIDEQSKRVIAEEELEQKKNDYLNLLSKYLDPKKDIPDEIKRQLEHLIEEYLGLNEQVSGKLKVVQELMEEGKAEIAIEKLVTIIESLLKEKYVAEGKAKDKRSCPRLVELFEKAKEFKWITKHHFAFSHFIRDKRNEEAHELNAKLSENETFIAFFAGIEIIYRLQGIKLNTAIA